MPHHSTCTWFTSIGSLWGHDLPGLPKDQPLKNAWLLVEGPRILAVGTWVPGSAPVLLSGTPQVEANWTAWLTIMNEGQCDQYDMRGQGLVPSFCDPHTHLVWAGDRSSEMMDRLRGATYAQIAEAGGGILSTVAAVRALDQEELLELSQERLNRLMKQGVASLEIKSGYGLSLDAEAKMLRVARELGRRNGIRVANTFLGLHALPPEFRDKKNEYVETVLQDWLPRLVDQGLVDAVDIFCEQGYFDLGDLEALVGAGDRLGLPVRAHVNQFNAFGGIKAACQGGLLSMDHLEVMGEEDWGYLGPEAPVAVGLPLCSLYLKLPFAPLGDMVARGQRVALGSDMNPGSAPSGNPWLTWSLGILRCGLSPVQALEAVTHHSAQVLGFQDQVGSLKPGMDAHFLVLSSDWKPEHVAGGMGSVPVLSVWFAGRLLVNN
ncbi:MAG: imidazolonepropionase [Bacteroidia bacterium]